MTKLRIVLGDGDKQHRLHMRNMLQRGGHQVLEEGEDSQGVMRAVRRLHPDLVIVDVGLAGLGGLEVAELVSEERLAPVILISSGWEQVMARRIKNAGVAAFLIKPITEGELLMAVDLAQDRFSEVQELEKEISELKDTIEARKVIEKAKGLLMKTRKISEADAFARLRQMSMNQRVSMRVVAESLILSFEQGRAS
jgi:two-component system, response regulator PdtaR